MNYELWRQDDNGNRFLIGCHADRSAAEAQLDGLSRVFHKQIYWIVERTDEGCSCRPEGD